MKTFSIFTKLLAILHTLPFICKDLGLNLGQPHGSNYMGGSFMNSRVVLWDLSFLSLILCLSLSLTL